MYKPRRTVKLARVEQLRAQLPEFDSEAKIVDNVPIELESGTEHHSQQPQNVVRPQAELCHGDFLPRGVACRHNVIVGMRLGLHVIEPAERRDQNAATVLQRIVQLWRRGAQTT